MQKEKDKDSKKKHTWYIWASLWRQVSKVKISKRNEKKFLSRWGFGVLVCVIWGLLESLSRIIKWSKLQSPWLPKEYETVQEQGQLLEDQVKGKEWAVEMMTSGGFWIYFKELTKFIDWWDRVKRLFSAMIYTSASQTLVCIIISRRAC